MKGWWQVLHVDCHTTRRLPAHHKWQHQPGLLGLAHMLQLQVREDQDASLQNLLQHIDTCILMHAQIGNH